MNTTIDTLSPVLATPSLSTSTRARWGGRIASGAAVLFTAVDAIGKLAQATPYVEGSVKLGFQPHHVALIGLIELVCVALYLVPRTAVLGAVLLTGYLGGAVATHLRLDDPLLSHTLFPIYMGVLFWLGLYLRDARVRALVRPRPAC